MNKGIAKLLKDGMRGYQGYASLYELSTPMVLERWWDEDKAPEKFKYVVVSSANVPFSGPETYIFGADKDGKVVNWTELDGSMRGVMSHETVLRAAGYEVVK